jgi:hypothetical protein
MAIMAETLWYWQSVAMSCFAGSEKRDIIGPFLKHTAAICFLGKEVLPLRGTSVLGKSKGLSALANGWVSFQQFPKACSQGRS